MILHSAVFKDVSLYALIPESVLRLIAYYEYVQNNDGVVYAIRIPDDLTNLELENNVLYTAGSISQNSILAKVVVREIPNISLKHINDKLKEKLLKSTNPVGLQILFGRKLNHE